MNKSSKAHSFKLTPITDFPSIINFNKIPQLLISTKFQGLSSLQKLQQGKCT